MDRQIEDKRPTSPSLVLTVGDLGVDEGHSVVVPVHENDGPLSQNQESCIPEFGSLGHNEHPAPEPGDGVCIIGVIVTVRS